MGGGRGWGNGGRKGGGQEFKGEGKIVRIYHITSRKGVDISRDCPIVQEFYLTYSIVM